MAVTFTSNVNFMNKKNKHC